MIAGVFCGVIFYEHISLKIQFKIVLNNFWVISYVDVNVAFCGYLFLGYNKKFKKFYKQCLYISVVVDMY